ncbi:MAG: HPr family phosphocarrier protein [Candidatus Binatia bacterium]|nr:HPr family phosphocarrier protein [Candidatus Binatia bacterium]MDG2010036.1 HPr family phosphocarrier protein [Candidatus Binatia bacterium]HAC80725.1 HPr family phosphocarrier protein [Deltaproteobacteria bacterium]
MLTRSYDIVNRLGLHARAAAQLVQLASGFAAELSLRKDDQSVNGKSIMGVMMLAAGQGSVVEATAEGEDASEMLDALGILIEAKFNEDR